MNIYILELGLNEKYFYIKSKAKLFNILKKKKLISIIELQN